MFISSCENFPTELQIEYCPEWKILNRKIYSDGMELANDPSWEERNAKKIIRKYETGNSGSDEEEGEIYFIKISSFDKFYTANPNVGNFDA